MYTKPTLADLKQSLADRLTSGNLPNKAATLTLWIRNLNRGVDYCVRKLKRTKSASLTTVSGQVALPDEFNSVNNVYDSSLNEWIQISPLDAAKAETSDQVYWISGDFAGGFYLNTSSDGTFTVNYNFQPSKMVADSDICPFEDEEAVVAYAYGMIRKSQSDPFADSDKALAECDTRLKEIQSQQNSNDNYSGLTLPQGS